MFKKEEGNGLQGSQGEIKTLISQGCKFEGNLYSPSYTRIDGTIQGNLTGDSGIVIGEKGVISGDVRATEVIVFGTVKGNITSDTLVIKPSGSVNGNIAINTFSAEKGAVYNGTCKMGGNNVPQSKELDFDLEEEAD